MKKLNWIQILVLFILLVGLPTVSFSQKGATKDKIRIGFSMALTGIYAPGAESQMNSYLLWSEEVNKKGGIFVKSLNKKLPVELVYYDDQSLPDVAVRIYEKLITQDKVDLIMTPWGTTIHFAIAPLSEKYEIPLIGTTAASVKLRELKGSYFWFITACIPDRQMKAFVEMLKAQKGQIKTVAIVYLQELFPRENLQFLEPALREANIQILLKKDYPMGVKDLTSLLTEVKSKNPDGLIALTYPADSFLMTAQAKEVGVKPKLMMELVGPAIIGFHEKFGPATEGLITQGHWSPKGKWLGAKEFLENYQARWKKKPDYLDSTLAYIGCQILEQAIEKAGGLDRKKLRDIIAAHEFSTINGPIKFTGLENLKTPSMWLQWQKGELEIVWPPEMATAKLLFPKPNWP
ncbi:MAG: branched-chain amino acid ABC transporter substrate-binding protein [Deltaproteobacteria bacterium]|nr:branched-chain amino acid ABC transporter substrate-binding protein [Deltaproteobacteria bacterium]